MTAFERFCARCQMRHDFGDMIQVRYRHGDGETYDTWVSGEEVMQRLRSQAAEKRLRGLSRLNWDDIREARETLPQEGKRRLVDRLRDEVAGGVEDFLGGNVIGDSLADAVRGGDSEVDPDAAEKATWQARLREDAFRAQVLELAWIALRGSFPPEDEDVAHDDWV